MDWNLMSHVMELIDNMTNDDDVYNTIMGTPHTYDGVKSRWPLQAIRGWWYLIWRTFGGKGIFIFLLMVTDQNNWEIHGKPNRRRFKLSPQKIWEDYFGKASQWTSIVPAQNPPAGSTNAADDNLGPWPKPGGTDD
ncbi:MAG: hypothetical protein RTV41_11020 [Candidatus Thorarchaeota archaeon]